MWRRWTAALALTTLAACAQQQAEPAPAAASASERGPAAELVNSSISWPAAQQIDRQALAGLPPEAVRAIGQAPLPVLVVKRASLLGASKLMAKPNWVALSAAADGITVSLSGSRVAHRYEHLAPARGNRSVRMWDGAERDAFVTQNEGIWSVAWVERGAAYSLEVECSALPDPRCADEGFVVELAASLAYVGGAGAKR